MVKVSSLTSQKEKECPFCKVSERTVEQLKKAQRKKKEQNQKKSFWKRFLKI